MDNSHSKRNRVQPHTLRRAQPDWPTGLARLRSDPRRSAPDPDPVRQRLLEAGPRALSDEQLMQLALGRQPADPRGLAELTLQLGPAALFSAPRQRLQRAGLSTRRWCMGQAWLELVRRSIGAPLRRANLLQSPEDVGRYLSLGLRHRSREVFEVLYLDTRNRLVATDELFQGTLNQTAVYPREVARRALEHNAAAVILAHNHPSGEPEPSAADRQLTERLQQALRCLDIAVLDHVIVAGGARFSFAEHGLL